MSVGLLNENPLPAADDDGATEDDEEVCGLSSVGAEVLAEVELGTLNVKGAPADVAAADKAGAEGGAEFPFVLTVNETCLGAETVPEDESKANVEPNVEAVEDADAAGNGKELAPLDAINI